MPELPDLTIYCDALERVVVGGRLLRVSLVSPFLLRTVEPPLAEIEGKLLRAVGLIGKRLVFHLENDCFLLLHLMIAGRLHWKPAGARIPGKVGLATFEFAEGSLLLTEAGSKKRASLHIVRGSGGLDQFRSGGIAPLEADLASFQATLARENHTLKRALTDPRLFSGIGNAYSDEILHRGRLSPAKLTTSLLPDETLRLFEATQSTLREWIERLREETGDRFPEHVTAFRRGMTVHGRYRQPCPVCGAPIQRIRYAENECNYCATCQTGGRLLADRGLSRLLGSDWPKSVEQLEQHKSATRTP
ncbi:MAG: DNA-formamidopyrimidine glycosylase family protein [Nitrospiraceae bacterium]